MNKLGTSNTCTVLLPERSLVKAVVYVGGHIEVVLDLEVLVVGVGEVHDNLLQQVAQGVQHTLAEVHVVCVTVT